jgi:hypothetical protein
MKFHKSSRKIRQTPAAPAFSVKIRRLNEDKLKTSSVLTEKSMQWFACAASFAKLLSANAAPPAAAGDRLHVNIFPFAQICPQDRTGLL